MNPEMTNKVLQRSGTKWLRIILIPIILYIILMPLLFMYLIVSRRKSILNETVFLDYLNRAALGYIVCIVILIVGGIFGVILARNGKASQAELIYVSARLVFLLALILPSLAATRL